MFWQTPNAIKSVISLYFISYNEKRGESTIHQIVMEINVSQRFQYARVDVYTSTFDCFYFFSVSSGLGL